MSVLTGIGRFCYDFVIGDDWKIAAAVVTGLALTLALLLSDVVSDGVVTAVGAVLLLASFTVSMVVDVGRHG